MRRLFVRLLANALGLYAAVVLVPGISTGEGSWLTFVIVAAILTLVNALVRPLLALLTGPIIIVTLGLFLLVINALMLWLAGYLARLVGVDLTVAGFVPAFLGALVITAVNWLVTWLAGDHRGRR
ncbi:MAG: phage holin family protein [Anaerolineae bacterium]